MNASLQLADFGWWLSSTLNQGVNHLAIQVIQAKDGVAPSDWKPGGRTLLTQMISALVFAIFLLGIALGQAEITGFFLWSYLACIVTASPLLLAWIQLQNAATPPINSQSIVIRPAATRIIPQVRSLGQERDWLWRGWNIHYTYLEGPINQVPVILLHGFGASIGHWRHNLTALAQHHHVYAIDLLGFGASAKPAAPYTIQLWSEQVYEFWQTFIGVPAILVGNSIGSLTCLSAAATYPHMTRGVAMISLPDLSSHEIGLPPCLQPLVNQLRQCLTSPLLLQPLFYLLRQPWVLRRWAAFAYTCQEAITDELLEILITPARGQGAAAAFAAMIRAMVQPRFSPNVAALLTRLQIPSLLLWGQQDRMIPLNLAQRFVTCNPTLQMVALENAGHCAHDECPERVNQELLTWIQQEVL